MTITLPLEPQKEAKLNAVAKAKGVTPGELVTQAIDQIIAEAPDSITGKEPTRSLRGCWRNTVPLHRPRKLIGIGPRCSRTFRVPTSDDADTHTIIWYFFSDPRLGTAASSLIDDTIAKGDHIGVSAISIVEMIYLVEKGRIPATASR